MSDSNSKLKQIVTGWANVAFKNKTIEKIAKIRADECSKCEHHELNKIKIPTCGKCGCPLIAKTRSSGSSCPIGKW